MSITARVEGIGERGTGNGERGTGIGERRAGDEGETDVGCVT
ncbi:hypothetical protein POG22_05670 [Geitlerinema sp. CS-897]|nr:hypothetical protein [Geitlerinema sp. CS-897]